VFDYGKEKIELIIDREPNVTRDRVNFKESLKTIEIAAVRKLLGPIEHRIEGTEMSERADVNLQNFERLPLHA